MFKKLKKFLIRNKIIGDFSAKIKIITDKENIKVSITPYSENFPISKITPKNMTKVDKEKVFTIKWLTNKKYTYVFLLVKEGRKTILNESKNLKNNDIKEIKI